MGWGRRPAQEAVLPFDRLPGSDTVLTPEMRSTGEVMGIADNFEGAFFKSQISAGMQFPKSGTVFLSIRNEDKTKEMGDACKILEKIGFKIWDLVDHDDPIHDKVDEAVRELEHESDWITSFQDVEVQG